MVFNEVPAAALQEVLQPAGAYADSMIALLTCTAASAAEVRRLSGHPVFLANDSAATNPDPGDSQSLKPSPSCNNCQRFCAISLTCILEEEAHMQLLERGRQAARHVKNAQLAVQQVEGMASKEQREKLRPSALTALEGRERELKVSMESPRLPRDCILWTVSACDPETGRAFPSQ